MEEFKKHIEAYIATQCQADELFAQKYADSGKTLDDIIQYLISWVKAAGCQVVAKEEIYSQVVHFVYGDADESIIDGKLNCHVVCATRAELTEVDKAEAKRVAIQQYQEAELAHLRQQNQPKPKPKPTAPKQAEAVQAPSLFDF